MNIMLILKFNKELKIMINVVAAIITNSEGKILIAQRNLKKSQGGLWEFPGGKIEPNETPEEA